MSPPAVFTISFAFTLAGADGAPVGEAVISAKWRELVRMPEEDFLRSLGALQLAFLDLDDVVTDLCHAGLHTEPLGAAQYAQCDTDEANARTTCADDGNLLQCFLTSAGITLGGHALVNGTLAGLTEFFGSHFGSPTLMTLTQGLAISPSNIVRPPS